MRILVDTDQLSQLAHECAGASNELRRVRQDLEQHIANAELDIMTRYNLSSGGFDAHWHGVADGSSGMSGLSAALGDGASVLTRIRNRTLAGESGTWSPSGTMDEVIHALGNVGGLFSTLLASLPPEIRAGLEALLNGGSLLVLGQAASNQLLGDLHHIQNNLRIFQGRWDAQGSLILLGSLELLTAHFIRAANRYSPAGDPINTFADSMATAGAATKRLAFDREWAALDSCDFMNHPSWARFWLAASSNTTMVGAALQSVPIPAVQFAGHGIENLPVDTLHGQVAWGIAMHERPTDWHAWANVASTTMTFSADEVSALSPMFGPAAAPLATTLYGGSSTVQATVTTIDVTASNVDAVLHGRPVDLPAQYHAVVNEVNAVTDTVTQAAKTAAAGGGS